MPSLHLKSPEKGGTGDGEGKNKHTLFRKYKDWANVDSITQATAQYFLHGLKGYQVPTIDSSYKDGFGAKYFSWTTYLIRVRYYHSSYNQMCNFIWCWFQ